MAAAPPPGSSARIGTSAARMDGRLRVTGGVRYGADFPVGSPAYAHLVTSTVAAGRIAAIDEAAARAVPGVLEVFTWRNVGDAIKGGATFDRKGQMEGSDAPLASDRILHAGQIVAMVVAEHYEQARDAAARLRITYDARQPTAGFDDAGTEVVAQADIEPGALEDPAVGDAEGAWDAAPVRLDLRYSTPPQHHNPIEPYSTTCRWAGDRLTVWESNRNTTGYRYGLATQLGISPDRIRVISPYVGGAFGCRGFLTQRTAIVALAARRLGRPVKLEVTRAQMFTTAAFRADTRQHLRLGAEPDGRLTALIHHGWEINGRTDTYRVGGAGVSARVYACPNVSTRQFIVRADRHTPGFMRAPPETPYLFALESAMDELSYALGLDPVELRRRNDTHVDPIRGLPITSRRLVDCFDAAAEAFGWSRRDPRPGSMADGDWQVGLGCASAMHTAQAAPATARVRLLADGTARVQAAAHDVGGGLYTAIAITVSDRLGIPVGSVSVELGDSDYPPSPLSGGSNTTTSVCNVVAQACEEIAARVVQAATRAQDGPFHGSDPARLAFRDGHLVDADDRREPIADAAARVSPGAVEALAEFVPHGAPDGALRDLYHGVSALTGGVRLPDRVQCSHGANFVELRVHRRTREVRVGRVVGAYAFGTVLNPVAARSQLMGAQIFGLSAALHEATEIDRRTARYTNDNLAEYMIPVSADIPRSEVIMLPEHDTVINPLGLKGVGELGNSGMNAAVANALFHATGVRVRDLPIRLEQLL